MGPDGSCASVDSVPAASRYSRAVEDPQPDDLVLLAAWRSGDSRSGAALVSRYFGELMRFYRNKTGSIEDAKELLAETMLACTQGRDRIEKGDFRKFVFGIAYNKLREHYRRRSKRAREKEDFSELCVADFDQPGSPETVVSQKRQVRLLARALRRLPLEQQVALELSFFEGEQAPAIAALLDLPVQTVYTRLRRGRERLAVVIHQLADDPETARSTVVSLAAWVGEIREQLHASAS